MPWKKLKSDSSGQILAGAVIVLVVMLVLTPYFLQWGKQESKWAVKEQKTTKAFNLAQAGIDRGMWKLKSSTQTWDDAVNGNAISGYDFLQTYNDLPGGVYRIRFSPGPGPKKVTVRAEGRDSERMETRAVEAVFENKAFPGAIIAKGDIDYSHIFEVHWGPVLAHGNINLSGRAEENLFPRKFSRMVVEPRDPTHDLNEPNTDDKEWWSNYPVPDLPILNFESLRKSAEDSDTLNFYNSSSDGLGHKFDTAVHSHGDLIETCRTTTLNHRNHFADSNHHIRSKNKKVWYWDGDVTMTELSGGGHGNGLDGTVIVRGNLIMDAEDNYILPNAPIPAEAWKEYEAMDTAATNEYPGDAGLQQTDATFHHGSGHPNRGDNDVAWSHGNPAHPHIQSKTDLGFRGLVYVGGNLVFNAFSEIRGVLWVNGSVINNVAGGGTGDTAIFYDDQIDVPMLNVVLGRVSWKEISPSSGSW